MSLLSALIEASSQTLIATRSIWLQELAEQLPPTTKLYGFDNSPEQFPAEDWRPPNMTLEARDCFEPFPQQYIGTFDVVHIRFFRCIVKNNDPEPLLRNLMTLLSVLRYIIVPCGA